MGKVLSPLPSPSPILDLPLIDKDEWRRYDDGGPSRAPSLEELDEDNFDDLVWLDPPEEDEEWPEDFEFEDEEDIEEGE